MEQILINLIAGAIGGAGVSQFRVAGGAGGAILTAIIGAIKNRAAA